MEQPLRARKPVVDHSTSPYPPQNKDKQDDVPFSLSGRHATPPSATTRSTTKVIPASKQRKTFWTAIGGGLDLQKGESRVLMGLTLLGAVVRFWHIGRPDSVV